LLVECASAHAFRLNISSALFNKLLRAIALKNLEVDKLFLLLQDEGDEAYLQTYISDDEDDADNDSNEYL
jgi:hypothetical protein